MSSAGQPGGEGLAIPEVLAYGCLLNVAARCHGGVLSRKWLAAYVDGLGSDALSSAGLERFLELFGRGIDGLQAIARRSLEQAGKDNVCAYNPLRRWPILLLPRDGSEADEVLVPVPQLLLLSVTSGLYWQLRRDEHYGMPFAGVFGKAFEAYLFHFACDTLGPTRASVVAEKAYGPRGRLVSSPDLAILQGRSALFLEAKQPLARTSLRGGASLEDIRKDAEHNLLKGIEQLWSFYLRLQKGDAPEEFLGLEPSRIVWAVVSYEDCTASTRALRSNALKAFESRVDRPLPFHVHVISAYEFERLVALGTRMEIAALLRRKERDDPAHDKTLHNWLASSHRGPYPSRPKAIATAFGQVMAQLGRLQLNESARGKPRSRAKGRRL